MKNFEGIKSLSPSMQTAAKTIYTTLEILKEEGGELPGREIVKKIPSKITLTEWEKERYEKSGYIRWQSILHFYTIDCSKAGFLRKQKGVWYITEEGENALSLGAVGLLEAARNKYKKWDEEREKDIEQDLEEIIDGDDGIEKAQKANLEQYEEIAAEGIKKFICELNPYEFQDLIAALLRAMDYFTPFISPKGRDGGLDIIAFQDPLGVKPPRI